MNQILIRDIVIAQLLSIITALVFNEPWAMASTLAYLFLVWGVEEYTEKIIRYVHIRRHVKKLRNRKVLTPASKQD